jgi:UDP-N-acetylmuramyl pentapeptide phosphotransferase/UDP-N-acetylglucosamine-1-phosphate transferase
VLFSAILVVAWVVMVINAINWADGVDGLSGGITLIASAVILILSLRPEVNQPPIAILSAILFGTVGAFLVFNFNPSRILAGTSGAMFMGFSLAVLAIFSGTKIATALLVLTIPIIDSFWVIGERIKKRVSIFKPDRNHLHYKLMELGWSQKKIAFSYWGITFVIAVIALNTRAIGKGITLITAVLMMIFILLLINKKLAKLNRK